MNNANNNLNNQINVDNQQIEQYRYATLGERILAVIIDWFYILFLTIIWFVFFTILDFVIAICTNGIVIEGLNDFFTFLKFVLPMLSIFSGQPLYEMVADASKKHASIGKRKLNMVVLDSKGNFLTRWQSFFRLLIKLYIPGCLMISLMTICCTEKKQSLHDLILGHTVVKKIN